MGNPTKKVFSGTVSRPFGKFLEDCQKQKQLVWLNSGYSQIAIIFPFVVAIPRYLRRELTLGGLMQVATALDACRIPYPILSMPMQRLPNGRRLWTA